MWFFSPKTAKNIEFFGVVITKIVSSGTRKNLSSFGPFESLNGKKNSYFFHRIFNKTVTVA